MAVRAQLRKLVLASTAFLALAGVASGDPPESVEVRLSQLEREVTQLREENRRQRFELESQSHKAPTLLSEQMLSSEPAAIPAAYDRFSSSQYVLAIPVDELQRLSSDIKQTQFSLQHLESRVDQFGDSLTVSLLDKEWSATVTGALIGEMIF